MVQLEGALEIGTGEGDLGSCSESCKGTHYFLGMLPKFPKPSKSTDFLSAGKIDFVSMYVFSPKKEHQMIFYFISSHSSENKLRRERIPKGLA